MSKKKIEQIDLAYCMGAIQDSEAIRQMAIEILSGRATLKEVPVDFQEDVQMVVEHMRQDKEI